ncbi:MAG: hypothetical protein WEE67_00305 [Chloroflexota bacterium]
MELRGAWITLMAYAAVQEPVRWRFRNREHAALLLRREGVSEPEAMVEALIERAWLDVLTDSQIEMHDHTDWQRYLSDMPDQRAERKRRSRAGHEELQQSSVTSGHESVTNRGEKKREEEKSSLRDAPDDEPDGTETILDALTEGGLNPDLIAAFANRPRPTADQ